MRIVAVFVVFICIELLLRGAAPADTTQAPSACVY
jgi:hypothetical protein